MDNYELRILDIINRYKSFMIVNRNILGVGLGQKIIKGNKIGIPSLTFFVDKKLPYSNLDVNNIIPQYFYGAITDVIEIGTSSKKEDIAINNIFNPTASEDDFKKDIKGGDIIINKNYPYPGIVSYKVNSNKYPTKDFLLSSSTVITGNSLGDVGDRIQRLSKIDGTPKKQDIGVISRVKDLSFYRNKTDENPQSLKYNELDMAVIVMNQLLHADVGTWGIKNLIGFSEVRTGQKVLISNRISEKIVGTVTALKSSIKVTYSKEKWAYFKDVILVNMPGVKYYHFGSLGLIESGVDKVTNEPTFKVFGILCENFKTSTDSTYVFFIPIQKVIAELKNWDMQLIL